jgi:hypothetical protein
MKVWKLTAYTSLIFAAFISIMLYTACERNPCDNVTCFNGGSCGSGICNCPSGYEGAQCQTLSRDRFTGLYVGYTKCNDGAEVSDTVYISGDVNNVNFAYIGYKYLGTDILHGYISNTVSTYSIIIPSDSSTNYLQQYTLTLQSDTVLSINVFTHDYRNPNDSIVAQCNFLGTKVL